MSRLKNTDYPIYLDANKLETEIKKALKRANIEIRNLLIRTMIRNIRSLPFKDNPVTLANGSTTSDIARKEALINSISKEGHVRTVVDRFGVYYGSLVMSSSVSAMEENFKESHIGWYYEVGTGEESDPSGYAKYNLNASLGDRNPYRLPNVGAPIVSRSAKHGTWTDLGGNLRKTSSQIGGIGGVDPPKDSKGKTIPYEKYAEMAKSFREYIGEDIQAYYWYERAVEEVSDKILDIYKKAIVDIDIFNPKSGILHLNKKIVISDTYKVVN